MKFDVLNRWSGKVQFTAEIECDADASVSVKLGLAVKWAVKSSADLSGANLSSANLSVAYLSSADLSDANLSSADLSGAYLSGAYLSGADLSSANLGGANLSRANLSRANLSGANLSGADLSDANLPLRPFKADLWLTLTQNRNEVPGLVKALREGRVDGSTYSGECACLVGTIANVKGVDYRKLDHNGSNAAERWFLMIREGDKPGDQTGGGFAAAKALEWALEWCALNGVEIDATTSNPGDER